MSAQTRHGGDSDSPPISDGKRAPAKQRDRPSTRELEHSSRSDGCAPPLGGALDTLAQLGQKAPSRSARESRAASGATLLRRARAKFFSTPLAIRLAMLRTPLERSYRNTVYCSATLSQQDGRILGTYCGNRWCMVCNRIRTARAIERYLPIVDEWSDKHLVTLTVKNVAGGELDACIVQMIKDFQATKLALRRTDRHKLVALRKLECTYNDFTREYHPHFHVVVQTEACARLLLLRWLERHPANTSVDGQDVRPCDGTTLREIFKYFTKFVAETRMLPTHALDVIFRSMKGHRVYQPVGFRVRRDLPDEASDRICPIESTEAPLRSSERVTWEWCQRLTDWIDLESGLCLTGYEPELKFRRLVDIR
jgi:hypothetical protein